MSEFYFQLLSELNLLRKNPCGYAEKILLYKSYFQKNNLKIPGESYLTPTEEGPAAYDEAANYLKTLNPLVEVVPSKGLGRIANEYLEKMKYLEPDKIGEIDIDVIINKYGKASGTLNTAVDFGNNGPEFVIISLIVSDGDKSRANRDLLLNPELKQIGFSRAKHMTYDFLTIIVVCTDFENTFDKNDNEDYGGLFITPKVPTSSIPTPTQTSNTAKTTTTKVIEIPEETKYTFEEQIFINEPDLLSYDKRERFVIERGIKKKKIILIKKYKDGRKKKEVKYITI